MKILYFLNILEFCFGFGLWWTGTTTTTTTENPLDYFMNEEYYIQDKILKHQLILPGTKYCGPGNKSDDFNDLGRFKNVDICCRNHDLCPDNIPAGKYKHGLFNNAKYTKSHCACDEIFHNCLKYLNNPPARIVGALYFSIFHINCYRKDYPITECVRRRHRRCLEYKLNLTATPVYQWFDNPFFKHWIEQFPTDYFINITENTELSTNTSEQITQMIDGLNSTDYNQQTNGTYYGHLFYSLYTNLVGYLQNLTTSLNLLNVPIMSNSSFDDLK